ncbi:MAG: hypothetical protein RI563_04260 [Thiohalophilus sp.]|uniref:hypothetical protein n=1 Tax=Thiohalophilus sp. TaxID=3028392 RepID=UPI002870B21A|nr:hypothetical protein [Thiohalophilus sp.]MDR9436064.1 hypothetical protein [Thiohalophilus sp.]
MRQLIFRPLLYIAFALMALSPVLAADMELEVIDLRHRPADEIVPLVKPFVVDGGSVTGKDYRLIIRSTGKNIDEIKSLLTELDTALRELTVYVSTDAEAIRTEQSIAVQGRIGNDSIEVRGGSSGEEQSIVIDSGKQVEGGASGGGRVHSTRSRSREPAAQTIRVQEGQWATIRTGQAVPITEQTTNPDGTVTRSTRYQNVTSGFQIRPQLNGEQVQLYIRPQRASVSESGGGRINLSGMETTIRTRLGEWVELGGSLETLRSQQNSITRSTRREEAQRQRVFVKIELQP